MAEGPELDDDQRAAAEVSPHERQIVLAPPGSGKTEVVAALLNNLDDEGLDPADEVLVLSFSRAAVGALRRRVGSRPGPSTAIVTLDSLASRLLDDLDDDEWRHLTFDKRIVRATGLLAKGQESVDIDMVRHLIVDEVQDLVGIRARLVLAIIAALDGGAGFTLLGDPDQSVYDFQLASATDMTSAKFLDEVRMRGNVENRRLTTQYRARTDQARKAATMLAERPKGRQRTEAVRAFLATVPVLGTVDEVGAAVQRWKGTTAFLCRTNGQVLLVAEQLQAVGVRATARAAAEELPVAPWVGEALRSVTASSVRRDAIYQALEATAPQGGDEAWRLLKQTERDFQTPDRIDIRRLRAAIARRAFPAELVESGATGVQVSTVHRAKGLEFDNVVLVNPSELLPGNAGDEETSVAYVALTRARDQVLGAHSDFPKYLRKDTSIGRWVVGGYERYMTFGVEIRAQDSMPSNGLDLSSVPVGARLELTLDPLRSELEYPVYSIRWDGLELAVTTEDFGRRFAKRIGPRPKYKKPWPRLGDIAFESVETRVADVADLDGPLIETAPRLTGMAKVKWKRTTHED